MSRVQVVRDLYRAYETGDRALVERHLSDDFVFSAPPDESRCVRGARIRAQRNRPR